MAIKQDHFKFITEYRNFIVKTVEKLARCTSLSPRESAQKMKETFLLRLSEKTKIRMKELQKTDESGIYYVIKKVEEHLKLRLDETKSNSKPKQQKHDDVQKKVKVCSHHITNTHDTEACHFLQKLQKHPAKNLILKKIRIIISCRRIK